MTELLLSDAKPDGYTLEDILRVLRKDILARSRKIQDDNRDEAQHVLANNIRILGLLTESIGLAEDSTYVLNKSYGRSNRAEGGPPRIGDS